MSKKLPKTTSIYDVDRLTGSHATIKIGDSVLGTATDFKITSTKIKGETLEVEATIKPKSAIEFMPIEVNLDLKPDPEIKKQSKKKAKEAQKSIEEFQKALESEGIRVAKYMLPEGPIMMDTATSEHLDRIAELHGITRGHDATGRLEPDSEFRARIMKSLESHARITPETRAFYDPESGKEFQQHATIDLNEIHKSTQEAFHKQQIQDFLTALDKL